MLPVFEKRTSGWLGRRARPARSAEAFGVRPVFTARAFALLGAGVLALGVVACSRPAGPSAELVARYQPHADRMCRAIVDCIKADVARSMKAHPERRDMVLRRMDGELCVKNQYRRIGDLSVWPGLPRQGIPDQEGLYRLYAQCAQAVSGAPDCTSRKRAHREAPPCVKLNALTDDLEKRR